MDIVHNMEENYKLLIDWLVTTFRALPGIDTPEFRTIIYLLYTPEDAKRPFNWDHPR